MARGPRVTHSELLSALEEAHNSINDGILPKPPKGYFTAIEYANQFGLLYRSAMQKLDDAVTKGKLVKIRARNPSASGSERVMVFFGKKGK